MLDRELRYHMPFDRLQKLSRQASRKAFSTSWYAIWALLGGYFAILFLLFVFSDHLARLERETGIPWWSWLVALIAMALLGMGLLRRHGRKEMRARANYDSEVTLRQEPEGLRFATPDVEYFVKWNGMSQMMMVPDGVVVSHGSLFFLIPSTAFSDEGERIAFVRDVYSRLNPAAVERSEDFMRALIETAPSATRT